MATLTATPATYVPNALAIPRQTHEEAGRLAAAEFERLLAAVEAIPADCLDNSTDCTLWNVRQMVAHLYGACAGHISLREFWRQYVANPLYGKGMASIDAINGLQVADRDELAFEQLVEGFRESAPRANRVRQRIPWLVRNIWMPLGPLGLAPIGYLTDTIYTRDWWMHRADLCRATGQKMHLTSEHDGRLVGLILLDLARKYARDSQGDTIDLHLVDDIELLYRFGEKRESDATITMNLVEFNRLASGRIDFEQAATAVEFAGNAAAARSFLRKCDVPY